MAFSIKSITSLWDIKNGVPADKCFVGVPTKDNDNKTAIAAVSLAEFDTMTQTDQGYQTILKKGRQAKTFSQKLFSFTYVLLIISLSSILIASISMGALALSVTHPVGVFLISFALVVSLITIFCGIIIALLVKNADEKTRKALSDYSSSLIVKNCSLKSDGSISLKNIKGITEGSTPVCCKQLKNQQILSLSAVTLNLTGRNTFSNENTLFIIATQ